MTEFISVIKPDDAQEEVHMPIMEYKCPNCDGAIEFDTASQEMKCPFCGSSFDVEALKDLACDQEAEAEGAENIEWDSRGGLEWQEGEQENMRVYSCNTCAGEVITETTTAATSCPYCGNPVIIKGQLSGCARPDLIIPFKLDKKAAIAALAEHFKGKRLLPKCFKTKSKLEEIKGLYVPFWLFDAEISADMRYSATKVRVWSDSNYKYTETKYFNVRRKGNLAFDKVPVDASEKMPDDLMESIEPFDPNSITDFKPGFLSGFLADKFDFCGEHCITRANERIKKSAEDAFMKTVTGYTTVMPEHAGIRLDKSVVKYALLPVWVMNTTWREKNYLFAMNGQSGKFVGDLPTDWGIFWKWFGILSGSIALFLNLIYIILLITEAI